MTETNRKVFLHMDGKAGLKTLQKRWEKGGGTLKQQYLCVWISQSKSKFDQVEDWCLQIPNHTR